MEKRPKKRFRINPDARNAVYQRSGGVCERCGNGQAVHLHHLTYERAGRELPTDLERICLICHCAAHPEKLDGMFAWELQRRADMPSREFDEVFKEQVIDRIQGIDQPAWNRGNYTSSGYDIEAVEQEERDRAAQPSELHHILEGFTVIADPKAVPLRAVQSKLKASA